MKYNKDGIRYFMFLCSKNIDDKFYMILPYDIKIIIWDLIYFKPFIQCFICNKILLLLRIDIRDEYDTENFIQTNGAIRCVNC